MERHFQLFWRTSLAIIFGLLMTASTVLAQDTPTTPDTAPIDSSVASVNSLVTIVEHYRGLVREANDNIATCDRLFSEEANPANRLTILVRKEEWRYSLLSRTCRLAELQEDLLLALGADNFDRLGDLERRNRTMELLTGLVERLVSRQSGVIDQLTRPGPPPPAGLPESPPPLGIESTTEPAGEVTPPEEPTGE